MVVWPNEVIVKNGIQENLKNNYMKLNLDRVDVVRIITFYVEDKENNTVWEVIHNDDFDGEWIDEWAVGDDEGNFCEDEDMKNQLIDFCKPLLNEF